MDQNQQPNQQPQTPPVPQGGAQPVPSVPQAPETMSQQPVTPPAPSQPTTPIVPSTPPASETPSQTPQPSPAPETPDAGTPQAKHPHTLLIMMIITAAVLSLGGFGLYMIMNQQDESMNLGASRRITTTPTAVPTVSPTPMSTTDTELDAIDTGNPEADLKDLDQEINGL